MNLETLVKSHRDFLAFVERRVGSRAVAEDILQEAFIRGLDASKDLPDDESAVRWFYRVLRNAVIDHYRRNAAAVRRADAFAAEAPDPETHTQICQCVKEIATTLKPEYADALTRIEVEGVAVKDYATAEGISGSNAGVRIFRAREALKKQVARACGTCAEHGCFDCHCKDP